MDYFTLSDFTSVEKYDSHVHLNTPQASFIIDSKEDNFKLLSINTDIGEFVSIDKQQAITAAHLKATAGDVNYATTFSVKNFNEKSWLDEILAYLEESIALGAVAVKVWKNIGMELRDEGNNLVMIDDPRFEPVWKFLIEKNIPVIGHIGEPKNCWLPLEQMTVKGDVNYFAAHPEYHMYLHPGLPSHEDHIDARDRMLEKNTGLQFIGAHFGSMEWSTDEIAKRLDRFSNFAVDTAERISHLQLQAVKDWQKVHDFVMKYQDRIIYGTDIIADGTKDRLEMKKQAHDIRLRHWKFFTSSETMRVPKVDGEFRGLGLPASVVDKIYRSNVEKWIPGLRK